MFWLFVCFIAFCWFVNLVSGGSEKRSAQRPSKRPDPVLRDPEFDVAVEKWKTDLKGNLRNDGWIASSTAHALALACPPPQRSAQFKALAASDPSPADRVRRELAGPNQAFLERQKSAQERFFRSVEKNPLTDEQIHACVCMDANVLVVAAAGSGKTSTIVAKAGYAIKEKLARPEGILLLAFNADAAKEIGERIQERLSSMPGIESVTARTFHAFGREVIAKATGKKPSIAPWVEQGRELDQILIIAKVLASRDRDFKRRWDLFRTVYARDLGRPGSTLKPDSFRNGRHGLLTANGETVKSFEERRIADWLFYHGIEYEYERPYEHDTATETHGQYQPDFYYPAIGLYHEHFAIDRSGQAPRHFKGYLAGIAWKRELHSRMGTELFETTSGEMKAGAALLSLEAELVRRGLRPTHDPERKSSRNGTQPIDDARLAGMIRVFHQHVKNNDLGSADLNAAIEAQFGSEPDERFALFLSLFERIAAEWERHLRDGGYIDFDDMLIEAADLVEKGRYSSPFTMILADEFQDSSRTRVRLLKALAENARRGKSRRPNQQPGVVQLCVVGDDWQGINRFAGADISVMTEFEKLFDDATTLRLSTTFRCPQAICDVSSAFVQQNPLQIRKTVKTTNLLTKDPVQALALEDEDAIPAHLGGLLEQMHRFVSEGKLAPTRGSKVTVLLLGRYRRDEPAELALWRDRFSQTLQVDFRTIHASKGLEAEYVFIMRACEGRYGFPSAIDDDPVLQLAMPSPEPFDYAEERRLFYVALTRASKQVRVYTSIARPSRFITEAGIPITAVGGQLMEPCPKCSQGVMLAKNGKNGPFKGCSTFPRCRHTSNISTSSQPRVEHAGLKAPFRLRAN